MIKHQKSLFIILVLFTSIKVIAQDYSKTEILSYTAICDENEMFENHYRINSRILSKSFNHGIYSLAMDVYGNCSISDTSWTSLNKDTLNIWTGPTDTIVGEYRIFIPDSECDCYFHLNYDIKGLLKEPKVIQFNGLEIKESNDKFLPEQYITLHGEQYLIFDSNGVNYNYDFYETGVLKRIRKESGLLAQIWFFSETGELIEIWIDNRAIPGGKFYKKEIKNTVANKPS